LRAQLETFATAGRVFRDVDSGATEASAPELDACLEFLSDPVYAAVSSRSARSQFAS
jgi:hypothetical protein